MITKILIDASDQTGVYYDEGGHPMQGSALVRDPEFQDRVVAETRALLSRMKMGNRTQLALAESHPFPSSLSLLQAH